jgi:MerR HTH family regulatory protein
MVQERIKLMADPMYTEKELALATGLSLSELRGYLRRYGPYIPTEGTGPRKYPASAVERIKDLKRIRELRQKPRKELSRVEKLDVLMDKMWDIPDTVFQLLESVQRMLDEPVTIPTGTKPQPATDIDSLPIYLQGVRPPKLANVRL